jgi:hypothetical protein
MGDPRVKYERRRYRLRGAARRWSVLSATLTGAALVLLPYHGIGLPDAAWLAAAGGSAAVTWWRWRDLRELTLQGPPPPVDPELRAAQTQARIESVIGRLPIGRTALNEVHRVSHLSRLRGSAAAPAGARLDKAVKALASLAPRMAGEGTEALREARTVEVALRDMAERIASVERALPIDGSPQLRAAHADLLERFTAGVGAYENMVSASAHYVAEQGRLGSATSLTGLIDASDRLRGFAAGLADLRATDVYGHLA